MLRTLRTVVGAEITFAHAGWLCVAGALGLSLLGVYAIDLGNNDVPETGVVTFSTLVVKQLAFMTVGLVAAALIAVPHYKYVRLAAWPAMAACLALLVFLLVPFVPASLVTPRNGARAWINLGPVDFQPAEVTKVAFVLVVAAYLRFRENHRTVPGLIPPAALTFVPAALITLQPDLGTALLFAPTIFAMLVAAGAKLKHLALVVLVAMLAAPAAYPYLKPHQKARIVGLIQMVQDPRHGADAINYQAITAQTLAGAGGLTGVTDAKSRALIRFNRLPERHNDMILAVIMNRFGVVGAALVAALYAMWFMGAYLTAALSKDAFGRLVVVGFIAITAAQAFINAGMTLGVLPIIGLTLPFVSYGGSSMLTAWLMTGLVVNIAMRRQVRLARPAFEFGPKRYDPAISNVTRRVAPKVRVGG